MSFIIKTEREREKEGPGVASLNSVSSTGSHLPVKQKVACGGYRRVQNTIAQGISLVSLEVFLQSCYLAYVFRPRGNFKDRQTYTVKNPGEFSLHAETDLIQIGAMESTTVGEVRSLC